MRSGSGAQPPSGCPCGASEAYRSAGTREREGRFVMSDEPVPMWLNDPGLTIG
jgi:hypothetical protein